MSLTVPFDSDKKQVEAPVEAKQAEEPSKTVVSGVGLQLAYGDSDEESGGEEENVEEETKVWQWREL